jgi:hypothetical protein
MLSLDVPIDANLGSVAIGLFAANPPHEEY